MPDIPASVTEPPQGIGESAVTEPASGVGVLLISSMHSRITAGATEGFTFDNNGDYSLRHFIFASSAIQYVLVNGVMSPRYAGGGLDVVLPWVNSGTGAAVRLQAEFSRIQSGEVINSANSPTFDSLIGITVSEPGSVGNLTYSVISLAAGDLDGIKAGEGFILRLSRDPTHSADTSSGTVILYDDFLSGNET